MKVFSEDKFEKITLGAGCFWCVEAVFSELKGVKEVKSGYSGGHVEHPNYREICTGKTGHAEVCQVTYNEAVISTKNLLTVYFLTHDPTTLNRQGMDVGDQYRSVIFYHNKTQKHIAEELIQYLDSKKVYDNPIVTKLNPFSNFYEAEKEHQDFFIRNPQQPYCRAVISPKLQKFRKQFESKLKK